MVRKAPRSTKPAANQEFLSQNALQPERPSDWSDFGGAGDANGRGELPDVFVGPPGPFDPPSPPADDAVLSTGGLFGVGNAEIAADGTAPRESAPVRSVVPPSAASQGSASNAPAMAQNQAAGAQRPQRRSVTCLQCGREGHQRRTCTTALANYVAGFPRAPRQRNVPVRAAAVARVPVAEERQVLLAEDRAPLVRNQRLANVPAGVLDANVGIFPGGVLRHEEDMVDDGAASDGDDESGDSSDSSADNDDVDAGQWNFAASQWECVCDETAADGQHVLPLAEQPSYNLRSPAAEQFVFGREVPSFRGPPGTGGAAAVNIPQGCTTAKHFVELLFTDDMIQKLVDSTNAAAHPETGHPRVKELWRTRERWHDVDVAKMRTWLCVAVYLGVVKVQNRKHVWSKSSLFRQPWVAARMTALDFDCILTAVNFCDHWTLTDAEFYRRNRDDGPFWQVKDLVARCNANSEAYFRCGHRMSIDEGVIPFKGKHSARCFNPKKPFKYHLKKFMCNDAETGYCYRFYFYDGAGEVRPANMPATAWPVVNLLTPCTALHNKNHLVATDNWFTNATTGTWLQHHGFHCVGTIKANRLHLEKPAGPGRRPGFPKQGIFKGARRPRGSIIVHRTTLDGQPHVVTAWQDKKPVLLLSSYMPSKTSCTRKVKIGGRWESVVYPRPSVIRHYNNTMGGTDLHDQRVAYFRTTLKSVRWHVRVLTDVFSSMLMNAYILFKFHHKKTSAYSALDFLEEYLRDAPDDSENEVLSDDDAFEMQPGPSWSSHKRAWWFGEQGSSIRKAGRHYMCHASELFGVETDQRRGCMWAPSRDGCGRTAYACKKCRISLCMAHFEQFHEE